MKIKERVLTALLVLKGKAPTQIAEELQPRLNERQMSLLMEFIATYVDKELARVGVAVYDQDGRKRLGADKRKLTCLIKRLTETCDD